MAINEAYVFDAGWLFFAGWSMVLLVVGVIAFGRDLGFFNPRHQSTSPKVQETPNLTAVS